MAIVSLTNTQTRNHFFQQTILANLHYWQGWLADKIGDTTALDRERNGLIRAISFALDLDEAWGATYELIDIIAPYMERRGYWDTWNWVLSRAIGVAQKKDDVTQLATLYHLLARLLGRQSRFRESVAYYRRAIQLSRQIGDRFAEGRACTNLGFFYIEQGNWYRAEVLCCHALDIFERIDNNHGRAHTENHLGILYTRQRQWEKARQHLERACTIWQSMGDGHGLMYGFMNLGLLYNEMEQPNEALSYSEKALYQAKLTGEELEIGNIYNNMGIAYRLRGEPAKAEAYARRAEAIFRRFSNVLGLAQVRTNLGLTDLDQEKWEEANLHLEAALKTWRNLENKYGEIRAMCYLIEYELARGNRSGAAKRLSKVEQLIGQDEGDVRHHHLHSRLTEYRRSLTEYTARQATAD